jgi:hypothetical protein
VNFVLNSEAFERAKRLIREARYVADGPDGWSKDRPPVEVENDYLLEHGDEGFATWYLGVDRDEHHDVMRKYGFAYGDFENVHVCGLVAVEALARQQGYEDIQAAARELRRMIDERLRFRAVEP